jgi:hypothetical protein
MTLTKTFDGKVYKFHELHDTKKDAQERVQQLREDLKLKVRLTKGNTIAGFGWHIWVRK